MASSYPPIEILKECLQDTEDGVQWLHRPVSHFSAVRGYKTFNGQRAGKRVGTLLGPLNKYRIISITVRDVKYQILEHIAVWALHNGLYPDVQIDHEDGDGLNNKISNLRLATHTENMHNKGRYRNNSSGHVGVHWYARYSKWCASGRHNDKRKTIGYFDNIEDAIAARKAWEVDKDFSHRHGT